MAESLGFAAGALGMLIALIHGYLGSTRIVAGVTGVPRSYKRVLHGLMQLTALYWFAAGVALVFGVPGAGWIGAGTYASAALVNGWAFQGRHFGAYLLALAAALALASNLL